VRNPLWNELRDNLEGNIWSKARVKLGHDVWSGVWGDARGDARKGIESRQIENHEKNLNI